MDEVDREERTGEEASSLPTTIQPGPDDSSAIHHESFVRVRSSGRKRRKSTCSPTCTISAKVTEAAAPKAT